MVMEITYFVFAISSLIVALWSVLFGAEENFWFGQLYATPLGWNAPSMDLERPEYGQNLIAVAEVCAGASAIIIGAVHFGWYVVPDMAILLRVIVCALVGLFGSFLYVFFAWEIVYFVVLLIIMLLKWILIGLDEAFSFIFDYFR